MAGRTVPTRMCVGCRERAPRPDLLRVVVVEGAVVPDPHGRLPGRGASVHPRAACFDIAERRRAFPRAFRVPGPLDTSALRRFVDEQVEEQERQAGKTEVRESEAGRDCDERSMSIKR